MGNPKSGGNGPGKRAGSKAKPPSAGAEGDARQAGAARDAFLARMRHEVRTPLNAVLGFAQLMEIEAGKCSADTQREYARHIQREGNRLLALINDVLGLPRAEGDRDGPPRPPPDGVGHPPAGKSASDATATLLYVEDHPASRQLMQMTVRQLPGAVLHTAPNAEEGLELLRGMRPDLLLLDINLPGMGGLEALRHIRADPVLADIPAVAVSASAHPDHIQQALDEGFDDYLTKPVNIQRLLGAVASALSRPSAGRAPGAGQKAMESGAAGDPRAT